jgi:hypothetical protein
MRKMMSVVAVTLANPAGIAACSSSRASHGVHDFRNAVDRARTSGL